MQYLLTIVKAKRINSSISEWMTFSLGCSLLISLSFIFILQVIPILYKEYDFDFLKSIGRTIALKCKVSLRTKSSVENPFYTWNWLNFWRLWTNIWIIGYKPEQSAMLSSYSKL